MRIYSLLSFSSFLSRHRFYKEMFFFFSMGVFFHKHWRFPGFHYNEGYHVLFPFTMSYSSLPFPLVLEHSDIYWQLCMRHDCHIFLFASLITTRLLLDEIFQLVKLPFVSMMMQCQCFFTWWFDSAMIDKIF